MATSSAMSTDNQYIKYTITVTQNSQNVTNNSSNVTVSVRFYRTNTGYTSYGTGTVSCKINGTTYTAAVTPSQKITNSGIVLFSKTLTINHNTDGTKNLTCSAWIKHDVVLSTEQSYTQTLTTIPRKSTMVVTSGSKLGSPGLITITKQSSSFTHSLKYVCGTASGYITESGGNTTSETKFSGTSVPWTPPMSLASQNKKGLDLIVTFTLTTYSGSTKIGDPQEWVSHAFSIDADDVKPSVSATVTDSKGYSSTYGGYVQNMSRFNVVTTASGQYGATISSYKIDLKNASGKVFATYTKNSFTTDTISVSGTVTFSISATDSRRQTTTITKTATVLAYKVPTIASFSASRCAYNGVANAGLQIKFNATATSLSNKNTVTYKLEYKKSTESAFGSPITLTAYSNNYAVSNGTYTIEADSAASYDLRLVATDKFTSKSKSTNGSSMSKLFSIFARGRGWAFGKVAELQDVFDVAWKAIFRQHVCVGNKTGAKDGKTGVFIAKEGYIQIQRDTNSQTYHPYIGFYLDNETSDSPPQIRLNSKTKQMHLMNAEGYVVDKMLMSVHDDTAFSHTHPTTNVGVGLGVGSGGYNHGIYSQTLGKWMLYADEDGIVRIGSSAGTYKPYYSAGDASFNVRIKTAGYCTNAMADIRFCVPLCKPIIGNKTITIESNLGFILRCGDKYTHGSAASTYVHPTKYTCEYDNSGTMLVVLATFSNTTNAVNNTTYGVDASITITFS